MDSIREMKKDGQAALVLGYGSLLWKPDFRYDRRVVGYIEGYKRRFWQGNITHRGTKTNVRFSLKLFIWGEMFIVRDQEAKCKALNGLTDREVTLGGYDVMATTFYPREEEMKPCSVIVFMATPKNEHYLGEASVDEMAMQIVNAVGPCGTNIDYVTKMADYIKEHIPEDTDTHLFELDTRVREISSQQYLSLNEMIGQNEFFDERQIDLDD